MPTQGEGLALGREQNALRGGGGELTTKAVTVRRGSDKALHKSPSLQKLFSKAIIRNRAVKAFFNSKSKKPKCPIDIVCQTTLLLQYLYADMEADNHKHKEDEDEKIEELCDLIREMKMILYGTDTSEASPEACSQLTREFFKNDTLRLLIFCLPKLNLETRKDVNQIVANLQRQMVLIASDHLENNLDLMDHLIRGYEDPILALHYGGMLRECIRHQVVARYVLQSSNMNNFFDYIQLPNFDVAGDAIATFKELMTRHKSTVAEFLSENYSWFFSEFNSKLLESSNYITRRQAISLLGDILFERSNYATMEQYVSSKDNLKIQMNLMMDPSKCIQYAAFQVFKLFVANQNKPPEIIRILVGNKSKFLLFFENFMADKEDETFQADKAQVIEAISELEPCTPISHSGELFGFH
ncbi:hypothetical protein Leryth_005715 [Lithospermum erythrorhizon]|uniref:MO25-like protein n=1 Tax=Lithospermum erythrorhizon TaxID=34254 RepID=A0AAV3R5U1_LITER|nr:hypothetical protein Leryth_005715 [Lithospermum erythrorhizon]